MYLFIPFPETILTDIQTWLQIPIWLVLGITIQYLLVTLLIFKGGKIAPIRRLIAIIILTIASIYTSFFSIYNGITEDSLNQALKQSSTNDQAIQMHLDLKKEIFTTHYDDYEKLKKDISDNEKYLKEERRSGCGPKCNSLQKQIKRSKTQFNQLLFVEKIEDIFTIEIEELENKTVKDIYIMDQSALAEVPDRYKENVDTEKYNNKSNYYINPEAPFLIPYTKIREQDKDAIVSLGVASFIDGFSLILGNLSTQLNTLKSLATFLDNLIRNIKNSIKTVLDSLKREGEGFVELDKITTLKEDLEIIRKLIDKKQENLIDTLICFYKSINPKTKVINKPSLYDGETENIKLEYRMLIDTMKHLEWIKEEEKYCIVEENYQTLILWLKEEIYQELALAEKPENWDIFSHFRNQWVPSNSTQNNTAD